MPIHHPNKGPLRTRSPIRWVLYYGINKHKDNNIMTSPGSYQREQVLLVNITFMLHISPRMIDIMMMTMIVMKIMMIIRIVNYNRIKMNAHLINEEAYRLLRKYYSCYLCHLRWTEVMFSPLLVCLCL